MFKVLTVLRVPTALLSVAALNVVAADWEPRLEAQQNTALIGVEGRDNRNASLVSVNRFVALAWTATVGKTTDVFFSVSRDGSPFDPPRQVNDRAGDALAGGEQPPRVLLSAGSGTTGPRVAIVWASHLGASAIRLARSANGGREFMPAESVSPPEATGHRGWPAAAADRAGNAHVVWLDHGHGSWLTARSTSLTTNASRSVGPARVAGGVCYCCKTAIAAGPRGTLYAAWRHVYPGNVRDIAVAVSRDAGATFEAPVRVSEDGWEINGCPDDGPAVAVDSSGTLHIAWPTVVDGSRKSIFYATSRDGRTFTPRREVPGLGSDSRAHPQIAASSDGRVAIVWDEQRDVALVEVQNGTFSKPVVLDDAETDATYPVATYAADGLVVAWNARRGERSSIGVRRVASSFSGGSPVTRARGRS
ncbi:MAG TPA: sialidase family protein [Vicinamibacterales bacterium]|nr:sialidase family protein [Vicinamibacterales bacterium]